MPTKRITGFTMIPVEGARLALMDIIANRISETGLTQQQVAEQVGVKQPRISDLVNKKIDLFSFETLCSVAESLGCAVRVAYSLPEIAKEIK